MCNKWLFGKLLQSATTCRQLCGEHRSSLSAKIKNEKINATTKSSGVPYWGFRWMTVCLISVIATSNISCRILIFASLMVRVRGDKQVATLNGTVETHVHSL